MSLNWRFTDEAGFNSMSDKDKELNDAYVWGCLAVDIPDITDKTADEWCKRYAMYTLLLGAMYEVDGKPYVPTVDEVRKRIGLTTNVTAKTRAQFIKKVMTRYFA